MDRSQELAYGNPSQFPKLIEHIIFANLCITEVEIESSLIYNAKIAQELEWRKCSDRNQEETSSQFYGPSKFLTRIRTQ